MKKLSFFLLSTGILLIFLHTLQVCSADEKSADKKAAHAKDQKATTTEKKTSDVPLIIPDPLPTDPEENAKLAKAILEKASNYCYSDSKGFVARKVAKMKDGTVEETIVYHKNLKDGTFLTRTECLRYKDEHKKILKSSSIYINNHEGQWKVIGNTAIKSAYLGDLTSSMSNGMSSFLSQRNITIQDNSYEVSLLEQNNRPMYAIKLKHNFPDAFIKALEESMPKDIKEKAGKFDFPKMLPYMSVYHVGKEDNFIYSIQQYNKGGVKISEISYDSADVNVDIDEKLFSTNDYRVVIVNSIEEEAEIVSELLLKEKK